jgi:N utilization substance protein B
MLYRYDLNPDREPASDDVFIQKRLLNNTELVAFALGLLRGVLRNRDELDVLLKERAANWSLNRMAATDRNVLRMGAYEMLYSDTPGRVAINEAVDLARRFGSAHSSQFVNGILDRVLQELKRDR